MPGFGHGTLRRRRRRWAHSPIAPSRLGAGQRGGGAFLPDVFGDARQWIEAAFGADLAADPDTWSWTNITPWVQWDPGVNCKIGYPDESLAIVPASFSCELRNDQDGGGYFTLGNPLGIFWPNIKENTPIRARLDVGNGATVRFFGYATSWEPFWDAGRELATVKLQAHGISRRLRQGKSADQSAMWRFNMLAHKYPTDTNGGGDFGIGQDEFQDSGQGYHAPPVHYWPLEDRSGALQGTNAALPSDPLRAASAAALPSFASRAVGQGSSPIAVFSSGDTLSVTVPPVAPGADVTGLFPGVNTIIVPFLMHLPEVPGAAVELLRITTTGSMARVSLTLDFIAPGIVSVGATAYDSSGGTLGTMVLFNDMQILDVPTWMMLRLDQNGSDILVETDYSVHSPLLDVGTVVATSSFNTFTISSKTVGSIVGLTVAPDGDLPDIAIGHLGIYNGGLGAFPSTRPRAVLGRRGDTPTARLIRTCIENDVLLELVGTSGVLMGPQINGNFLAIISECQAADNGVLLDGLSPGLTFICRTEAYSQGPSLTLDGGNGMISGPLAPVHNDQGRVNTFTARNPYGLEATFTKSDGELGTDAVGVYDDSGDVPVALDSALYNVAAWKVAQGTVGGLRYPTLSFQLAKTTTSAVAQQWLDTRPFGRVDVLSLEPGTAEADRSFLLRGWTERWNSKLWSVTANTTDYRVWSVLVLADDTGDDNAFLGHLDTDGSTTSGAVQPDQTLHDDFEDGIAFWQSQNSWTIAADTTHARSGTQSMKLTPPGATASGGAVTVDTGVPCTAGASYVCEAWFYSVAGWSDCRAAVDWYNAANAFISSSLGSATSVPAATWTVSRQTFTAPAGAVKGRPRARQGGTPAATDVLWSDDVVFMPLLQLVTASGPLWINDAVSTYADDIDGLYVNADGLKLRVLGITGATSPQTLVVDPAGLLRVLPTGSAVSVWNPVVIGL